MSQQTNVAATIDPYCQLMGEIKFRIEAIKEVIHAKISIAGTTGTALRPVDLYRRPVALHGGDLAEHEVGRCAFGRACPIRYPSGRPENPRRSFPSLMKASPAGLLQPRNWLMNSTLGPHPWWYR